VRAGPRNQDKADVDRAWLMRLDLCQLFGTRLPFPCGASQRRTRTMAKAPKTHLTEWCAKLFRDRRSSALVNVLIL